MKNRPDYNSIDDENVNCLMLHPVSWPNHGPNLELYLAEEAIGLVKSLNWNVIKGPHWDPLLNESDDEDNERLKNEVDFGQPVTFSKK